MAKSNQALAGILRETADRLENGARYEWGHMGRCNCGHLAQCITRLSPGDIHRRALVRDLGEWSEHARDYCGTTGHSFEVVIDALFELGLDHKDIPELEYLSNPTVLRNLPGGFRYLQRNQRDDAIAYFRAWADLMEAELRNSGEWIDGEPTLSDAEVPSCGLATAASPA